MRQCLTGRGGGGGVVAGRSEASDVVTLTWIWILLSNGPPVMTVFAVILFPHLSLSGTVGLVLELV
jgi:hypothetical protein